MAKKPKAPVTGDNPVDSTIDPEVAPAAPQADAPEVPPAEPEAPVDPQSYPTVGGSMRRDS